MGKVPPPLGPSGALEAILHEVVDGLAVGVLILDEAGAPYYANAAAIRLLGPCADPASDRSDLSEANVYFVAGTDVPYPEEGLPSVRALAGLTTHIDDLEVRTSMSPVVVEAWGSPLIADGGTATHAVVVVADVTGRHLAETSLAEAQSLARVGSWELHVPSGRMTWSRELHRLLGHGEEEEPSYEALVDRTHPDDRQSTIDAFMRTLADLEPFVLEHRVLLRDGAVRWFRVRGRVELDAQGHPERLLSTAQDITEQKMAEDALLYQAFHDSLSGLPNRALLLDRLSQALLRLHRRPSTIAVLYLDIDRFKVINDSLGHRVGDDVLLAMATRLSGLIRPGDTLARIGGDEFVVLCEALSDAAEAVRVADRIVAAMTDPLPYDRGDLVLSVSIGVAVTSSATMSPESLLRDADAAMYTAKAEGRARSAVFEDSMLASAVGRLATEVALRRAITDGDLLLHYQPIVRLLDGQVIGHEALVRWQHPSRGLIGPDEFIPIAEETGLIVPLGEWVLREACLEARRFQRRDPRWSELTMSINLSGGQLRQQDLVELVASALEDAELRPDHVQLEMTESVLMENAPATVKILHALKALGVRLGIDDFGTGYSSLAYLRRFPVEVLKIDRSFIHGLGQDFEDSAVVAAVVSLADTLGFTTIAEGVETELQRASLIDLGCSRAQGFLFARPLTPEMAAAGLDLSPTTGTAAP